MAKRRFWISEGVPVVFLLALVIAIGLAVGAQAIAIWAGVQP